MDPLFFFPLAVTIAITPGPSNFCALDHGIRLGVAAALMGTIGRVVAFAIFLSISGLGLGAMLLASESAFIAMKWVGAAYLFWLGMRSFRNGPDGALSQSASSETPTSSNRWLLIRKEFLVGISNPKAVLLFCAIFPQFIDPSLPIPHQFLVLGSVYLVAEFVSSALYGLGGRQLRRAIATSRGRTRLNIATGAVFVGAGALLLASRR